MNRQREDEDSDNVKMTSVDKPKSKFSFWDVFEKYKGTSREDSSSEMKSKRKGCELTSDGISASEDNPGKKLKSSLSPSAFQCSLEDAAVAKVSDSRPSISGDGKEKTLVSQVPVKSSAISLKDLLADVIELEETPSGVVIPKGKTKETASAPVTSASSVISFKELISDVVNIEESPNGMVIPKEKLKMRSKSLMGSPPSAQTRNRKRNTFTIKQKIRILNEVDKGGRLTQLARKYGIASSTLATIIKDRNRLRCAESMVNQGRKRIRLGKYQNIDEAVIRWYWRKTNEGNKPIGPEIQEKAREFAKKFGELNFEGSNGWLGSFKERFALGKHGKNGGQEPLDEGGTAEVGLARANVCVRGQTTKRTGKDKDDDGLETIPKRNSSMTQDLKNKGGGLRRVDTVGDLVDVRYIARVLDDAVLHGEVVDSNEKDDHPLSLKVKEWWKSWKEEESNMDMVDGEDGRWWEGALWGAAAGTRRMIVLPPEVVSKMKGLKIKLSSEACLVYEVEILQIRRGLGNEEVKLGQTAGEACKPGRSIMTNARGGPASELEGTPRKGHVAGCSMSSAVTSTPSGSPPTGSNMKDTRTPADKASILSRMARMGQPTLMLPDLQARRRAASEGDDGTGKVPARGDERNAVNEEETHPDEEVELEDGGYILPMEVEPMPISSGSRPPPPRLQPRPIGVPQQPYQSSVYWHSPPQYSNVPSASSYSLPSRPESTLLGHPQQHQQYPYPSHTLALTGPAAMTNQPAFQDPHLSVFLSETRTQNAELRMAMGRLTDKVDVIMGKLDRSPQQQQPQEQHAGDLRAAFEKDRAEWKDKEEKFEKEMAEAKSKLTSRVVAVEERCKTLEKENTSLKKELEDVSAKLATMHNNRSTEIAEAVKSAMNSVYSHLQPEFSNGVAYEGLVVRKTLAATIREVTLKFLSSNTEEKEEPDQQHKGGTPKEVHTIRRKANKPEIKAKPDGRKVLLRKGSSPKIDVDAGSSGAQDLDKNVGNGATGYKEASKRTDDECPHPESKSSGRDASHIRIKDEPRSRSSSREGSLERVINPEPPSPPIFDAGELSESGEEWFP